MHQPPECKEKDTEFGEYTLVHDDTKAESHHRIGSKPGFLAFVLKIAYVIAGGPAEIQLQSEEEEYPVISSGDDMLVAMALSYSKGEKPRFVVKPATTSSADVRPTRESSSAAATSSSSHDAKSSSEERKTPVPRKRPSSSMKCKIVKSRRYKNRRSPRSRKCKTPRRASPKMSKAQKKRNSSKRKTNPNNATHPENLTLDAASLCRHILNSCNILRSIFSDVLGIIRNDKAKRTKKDPAKVVLRQSDIIRRGGTRERSAALQNLYDAVKSTTLKQAIEKLTRIIGNAIILCKKGRNENSKEGDGGSKGVHCPHCGNFTRCEKTNHNKNNKKKKHKKEHKKETDKQIPSSPKSPAYSYINIFDEKENVFNTHRQPQESNENGQQNVDETVEMVNWVENQQRINSQAMLRAAEEDVNGINGKTETTQAEAKRLNFLDAAAVSAAVASDTE
mmetsp:Transcript_23606/g.46149  ORF Transcript_23606/g.46149 Transcript_23606/m.46149 type:complete len:449 (+) Transcript_23606:123-1469(+)